MAQIIAICFAGDARADSVTAMVQSYERYLAILRKKEKLTDEQIDEADDLAQDAYHLLLTVFPSGNSNYWHMIGSGHITWYLRKYKTLGRFQNQGFEHMNHLVKRFFLTRTQRGGRCGSSATRATRVEALGRWIQRRTMWLLGLFRAEDVALHGWKEKPVITV